MVLLNIKKLFSLRNKKVSDSAIRPISFLIITAIIMTLFLFIGSLMNKYVCRENGGKMPVFDEEYYPGMFDNDPKHKIADENTKMPWLADWIHIELDSKLKISLGYFIGAPRIGDDGIPYHSYHLSPGDIIMAVSFNLFKIVLTIFILFYVSLIFLFILGKNFLFEED